MQANNRPSPIVITITGPGRGRANAWKDNDAIPESHLEIDYSPNDQIDFDTVFHKYEIARTDYP